MKVLGNLTRRVIPFSAILVLASYPLWAAEGGPRRVQIKIGTILASNQSDEFDPKLSRMKNQLKVMKYRSYRLLKEQSQSVPWQVEAVFELPGGRRLAVTPQEYRDKGLGLKVRLSEGEKPLADTTVRLADNGNFLLGGPEHEGGVLIISIAASTQ